MRTATLRHVEDGFEFWIDDADGTVIVEHDDEVVAEYPDEPDWLDAVHTFFCTPPFCDLEVS